MSVPTLPCPNCGTAWPPDVNVCPHCGYIRPLAPAWPPPPTSIGVAALPPSLTPKLVTGKAWGDVTLGIGLSFVSNFLGGVGLVVMPILYFTLRAQYPTFARGIGYGLLAGLALVLGALVWCFAALSNYHGG